MNELKWVEKPAGDLQPGDKTKWGYGVEIGKPSSFRTVSRVRGVGNGIVEVYHKETWEPYHDTYAKTHPVKVLVEVPASEKPKPWDEPHKHVPKQHRDGKEPWCNHCGLTAAGTLPEGRL